MNKDLDERLVPQGEYRDALNIEVRTSDGSNAGTVQTLYGNKERLSWDNTNYAINPTTNWSGDKSRFVGSVADNKADRAYFFIASPLPTTPFLASKVTERKLYKDMIVMYDNTDQVIKPVVTDIFRVEFTNAEVASAATNTHIVDGTTIYDYVDVSESQGVYIRPGMRGRIYQADGGPLTSFEVFDTDDSSVFTVREVKYTTTEYSFYRVYFTTTAKGLLTDATVWTFEADNVLNFTNTDPYNVLITGINIVDNLLFWTDNKSEPKKINIDRCVGEVNTIGESFELHSRLKTLDSNNTLKYALPQTLDPGLKEEHITVIRRAPRTAPKLEMSTFEDGIELNVIGEITDQSFVNTNGSLLEVGAEINVEITGITENVEEDGTYSIGFQYTAGQVIILENDDEPEQPLAITATVVKAFWIGKPQTGGLVFVHKLYINSINSNITGSNLQWTTSLEQNKPLFELNLGRFSYRYRYQDGEYSSFAPWSELAFLPGEFDYVPRKGYNLGMVNNIRYLRVTDFVVEDSQRPDDIVEVDILYKDTVSPNVRVVKSIKRNIDPEWNDDSDVGGNSGVVNISSEMMHRTLPSSQILRAWDNVPRLAKAQEITGNRIVYGNYLQNFNVTSSATVEPRVLSVDHDGDLTPAKSLKSIRKYKIGVVFGDKYGRETPVMGIGGKVDGQVITPSSISVEKNNSHKVNKLQAGLLWTEEPQDWMEYYKYYVKEDTGEYYNLVLHRWYNAEDGNVWLAFGSADRNKVDNETYITLKNKHGDETPILEDARYKILAIENEAPDYIKITEKIIGEVAFSEANDENDIDLALIVNLDQTLYEDQLIDINFKGTGWVRVKAEKDEVIHLSKWIKIAQMKDDTFSVVPIEPFGDSARLFENFGYTANDPSINWFVQVKDNVVENRPEFDGRFFVKVVRDGVLSSNILQTVDGGTVYNTVDQFRFNSIYTLNSTNPANSDAGWQGDYASDTTDLSESDPPSEASYNTTGEEWDANNNVHGISSDELFNQFANCDIKDEMQAFWQYNNANDQYQGRGYWFIDQAHYAYNDEQSDTHAGRGLRVEGGSSLIDFSHATFYLVEDLIIQDWAYPFLNRMRTDGTLFRFLADPFGEVYRVTSSSSISWESNFHQEGSANFFGYTGGCLPCLERNNPLHMCGRAKFTMSFVNASTGLPLDTNVWDPRSALRHDGTSSSQIQILEIAWSEGSSLDFREGNAVWETEPKENIDLDLYYEATNALPIRLGQENIESYCPTESPISIYRPDAVSNPISLATVPVVHTAVRDVIGVKGISGNSVSPKKIALNDKLKFTHANGAATEAEVVDHMFSIPLYSNTYPENTGGTEGRSVAESVATYKSSTIFTDIACTAVEGSDYSGIPGCMDPEASNYNPFATYNDGSCEYSDEIDTGVVETTSEVPEIGETWTAAASGKSDNGIIITRKLVDEDDETAGVFGFMLCLENEFIDVGEGADYTHDWDAWEAHFAGLNAAGNSSKEWATKEELETVALLVDDINNNPDAADITDDLNAHLWWSSTEFNYNTAEATNILAGSSSHAPKASIYRTRAIMRYTTEVRSTGDGRDIDTPTQENLSIDALQAGGVHWTTLTGFNTQNNNVWQAISATNADGTALANPWPVGVFVHSIGTNGVLEYTTNGDAGCCGIPAGNYKITFQEVTGYYKLNNEVHTNKTTLPWFNCYSFGNGLESDRIRDDFNAPQIDNGVKVSTLLDSYGEERRSSSMIYSGIYNSTSSVNNLNEFNMSGKITKDLNPMYGSIQALKTRDTNVIAFCEDKVFKVLANKDALYNADGSVNLTASDRVLGNATTFVGEYGISLNPESLAADGYRMYFADKQRNKVLRLSQDGITPISDFGMTSWFRDNLSSGKTTKKQELIGTFDSIKGEYNLSLRHLDNNGATNKSQTDTTISFNERSKGWSSFKSFVPEVGLSINNEYITGYQARVWSHHNDSVNANTFYGKSLVPSTIDVLFNDSPGSVKSFLTMNYEGSQAKINKFTSRTIDGVDYNDGEYYNLNAKTGWYVDSFNTDLQESQVPDFKQKEGKWFNYVRGMETSLSNLDPSEFSVQGIGVSTAATTPTLTTVKLTVRENNDE
jgi:hypothetical protein